MRHNFNIIRSVLGYLHNDKIIFLLHLIMDFRTQGFSDKLNFRVKMVMSQYIKLHSMNLLESEPKDVF